MKIFSVKLIFGTIDMFIKRDFAHFDNMFQLKAKKRIKPNPTNLI